MHNRIADYLPGAGSSPSEKGPNQLFRDAFANFSLRGVLDPVEQVVKSHPGAALATAFIVGVTVAWWIKRR